MYSDPLLLRRSPIADSPLRGFQIILPSSFMVINNLFFFNIKCYFLIFYNISCDFLIIVLIISGIVNSIIMGGLNNGTGSVLKI